MQLQPKREAQKSSGRSGTQPVRCMLKRACLQWCVVCLQVPQEEFVPDYSPTIELGEPRKACVKSDRTVNLAMCVSALYPQLYSARACEDLAYPRSRQGLHQLLLL
jgi:hypothetical protein